jgi:hypothetical protein
VSNQSLQPLDLVIAGTAPDELTTIALTEIQRLQRLFDPMTEAAAATHVEIPADPVAFGLSSFNELLSQVRTQANAVRGYLSIAITEKRRAQSRRDQAKTAYDRKLAIVLTSDDDVEKETGQQAKLALAKTKLERESRIISYCENLYTMVLGYNEALKLELDRLTDTKRDLMSQLQIIKQQIALGEHSGSLNGVVNGMLRPASPVERAEAEVAVVLASDSGDGHTSF